MRSRYPYQTLKKKSTLPTLPALMDLANNSALRQQSGPEAFSMPMSSSGRYCSSAALAASPTRSSIEPPLQPLLHS
eukprot:CAMPEP_0171127698 /NCGR_PEP_ID=MMETSP0766_2-20121228/115734_1 /TAXON_ID=439317 /ORGANISM="Gambierdiscus australes, Strain CAWD 149" /LENGTH=75 /DNA_ID=CAMNT_0011590807 /DNA_START=12 /DNA_END=237 /DNA_ORIENTATION=+